MKIDLIVKTNNNILYTIIDLLLCCKMFCTIKYWNDFDLHNRTIFDENENNITPWGDKIGIKI